MTSKKTLLFGHSKYSSTCHNFYYPRLGHFDLIASQASLQTANFGHFSTFDLLFSLSTLQFPSIHFNLLYPISFSLPPLATFLTKKLSRIHPRSAYLSVDESRYLLRKQTSNQKKKNSSTFFCCVQGAINRNRHDLAPVVESLFLHFFCTPLPLGRRPLTHSFIRPTDDASDRVLFFSFVCVPAYKYNIYVYTIFGPMNETRAHAAETSRLQALIDEGSSATPLTHFSLDPIERATRNRVFVNSYSCVYTCVCVSVCIRSKRETTNWRLALWWCVAV